MGFQADAIGTSEQDRAEALDAIMAGCAALEGELEGVGARYITLSTVGATINMFNGHQPSDVGVWHSHYTIAWETLLQAKFEAIEYAVNEAHQRLLATVERGK